MTGRTEHQGLPNCLGQIKIIRISGILEATYLSVEFLLKRNIQSQMVVTIMFCVAHLLASPIVNNVCKTNDNLCRIEFVAVHVNLT